MHTIKMLEMDIGEINMVKGNIVKVRMDMDKVRAMIIVGWMRLANRIGRIGAGRIGLGLFLGPNIAGRIGAGWLRPV